MKKRIMILGASDLQLKAYLEAKEMGIETVGVDMNPSAVALKYADYPVVVSTIDIEKVLLAAKKYKIDGIMTLASDMPMRTVANVCQKLNLPGIDIDTAICATDKVKMRRRLYEYSVPVPIFYEVNSKDEYLKVIKSFSSKFIVKPTDNSGSRGIFAVTDINNEKMVEEAFWYSKKFSREGKILVEELMEGPEISVESITQNGKTNIIQITDKITTGIPYFVEIGHSQPSKHAQEILSQVKKITKAAIKAIGIDNCPSHTEIKITSEGPKIVEIGARLGGGCITTDLVPLSTGIDMVRANILLALGEKVEIRREYSLGSAIRFFEGQKGVIKSINGIEEAEKIPGVKTIEFTKRIGENANALINGSERLGYVIAQGKDASEALEICNIAQSKIMIEIE